MRGVAIALLVLNILAAPTAASAQSGTPPLVVKSLQDPTAAARTLSWVGAAAGATAAIVGMNAWTGGALLAPTVGPAVSGILGGSWLGLSALTPLAAQSVMQTTSLIAVGVAGGIFGHWLGGE